MGKRKRYMESCQISEIKTYNLNGYPQKVLFDTNIQLKQDNIHERAVML